MDNLVVLMAELLRSAQWRGNSCAKLVNLPTSNPQPPAPRSPGPSPSPLQPPCLLATQMYLHSTTATPFSTHVMMWKRLEALCGRRSSFESCLFRTGPKEPCGAVFHSSAHGGNLEAIPHTSVQCKKYYGRSFCLLVSQEGRSFHLENKRHTSFFMFWSFNCCFPSLLVQSQHLLEKLI